MMLHLHVARSTRVLYFALGLGGLAMARPALAANPPAEMSAAEQLSARGIECFHREDYEGARAAFQQSYALDPEAITLMNLALAELQSGHPVDAARDLRRYLRDPGAEPAKIEAIRSKWLPRAESQTSRLMVNGPARAELLVDGSSVGLLPQAEPIDVSAGEHDVVVRLDTWSRESHVTTRAGETVRVLLEKPPAAPPPTPSQPPRATRDEAPADTGPSKARVATVIALGGVAVSALAVGTIYALLAQQDENTAVALRAGLSDDACRMTPPPSVCPALRQANESSAQEHNLSVGFFVTGGVLAASTVATWFLWPNRSGTKSGSRAWTVLPSVGTGTAGAVVVGFF